MGILKGRAQHRLRQTGNELTKGDGPKTGQNQIRWVKGARAMIVVRGIKILILSYLASLCSMRLNAQSFIQSDLCSDTHCILGVIQNMLGITRIIASTFVKDLNLVML